MSLSHSLNEYENKLFLKENGEYDRGEAGVLPLMLNKIRVSVDKYLESYNNYIKWINEGVIKIKNLKKELTKTSDTNRKQQIKEEIMKEYLRLTEFEIYNKELELRIELEKTNILILENKIKIVNAEIWFNIFSDERFE